MSERKVATDALETLGTIIGPEQKRDAIHLAVEPVSAGETLKAGEHIKVVKGIAHKTEFGKGQGIVDPFLTDKVRKGQRFWFVMYPRMVHSLRHVWTHPDFQDEFGTENKKHSKSESEQWLRNFCNTSDCPGFDEVMEIVNTGSYQGGDGDSGGRIDGDYIYIYGSDAHGEIPLEFWVHAENYLGRKLDQRPSYFTCSC